MKKTTVLSLLITLVLLLAHQGLAAHPETANCENVEARAQWADAQARQIAKKLQLSASLTAKLTEDYRNCQEEIWHLNKAYDNPIGNRKVANDDDAEKILKARFEKRRKFNQVQEKYYKKFSGYLSQRQILELYRIERKLMEKHFRKERQEGKGKKQAATPSRPKGPKNPAARTPQGRE